MGAPISNSIKETIALAFIEINQGLVLPRFPRDTFRGIFLVVDLRVGKIVTGEWKLGRVVGTSQRTRRSPPLSRKND